MSKLKGVSTFRIFTVRDDEQQVKLEVGISQHCCLLLTSGPQTLTFDDLKGEREEMEGSDGVPGVPSTQKTTGSDTTALKTI